MLTGPLTRLPQADKPCASTRESTAQATTKLSAAGDRYVALVLFRRAVDEAVRRAQVRRVRCASVNVMTESLNGTQATLQDIGENLTAAELEEMLAVGGGLLGVDSVAHLLRPVFSIAICVSYAPIFDQTSARCLD